MSRTENPDCEGYYGEPDTRPQLPCRAYLAARSLVVLIAALWATGCGSSSLPMPVFPAQHSCDATTVLPHSIRVMPAQYPAYTKDLIETLEGVALFEKVLGPDDSGTADLEATVDRLIYGKATVPILTILTLGIVPTVFTEEYGHEFSITAPGGTHVSPIQIDTSFESTTTLGWFGGLRALSPKARLGNPARSSTYFSNLRAAICSHKQELHELAQH